MSCVPCRVPASAAGANLCLGAGRFLAVFPLTQCLSRRLRCLSKGWMSSAARPRVGGKRLSCLGNPKQWKRNNGAPSPSPKIPNSTRTWQSSQQRCWGRACAATSLGQGSAVPLLFLSPGKGCCRRAGAKERCQRAALTQHCCQWAFPALETMFGPGQWFCSTAVTWGGILQLVHASQVS